MCRCYAKALHELKTLEKRLYLSSAIHHILKTLVFLSSLGGVSFLCFRKILHGEASPGDLVGLLAYWNQLQSPLLVVGHSADTIRSQFIAIEDLGKLLLKDPQIKNEKGAADMVVRDGEIRFDHVSFSYDSASKLPTLFDMSFCVPPGKTIALVGHSGAGKSTILELLMRLYDCTAGGITIDGHPLKNLTLKSLRSNLGIVPQVMPR